MNTDNIKAKPTQGAEVAQNETTLKAHKNNTQKGKQAPEKQRLTPEQVAEKIKVLTAFNDKRADILTTRQKLDLLTFTDDLNGCSFTIKANDGQTFHTTNPNIAGIFRDEAVNYCNAKLLEVDTEINAHIATL